MICSGKTLCVPQESGCLQRYHEAIRLQQNGQSDGARALYHEILGSKVMDEVGNYCVQSALPYRYPLILYSISLFSPLPPFLPPSSQISLGRRWNVAKTEISHL